MAKYLATLIGAALLFMATAAMAVPITGSIDFLGIVEYTGGTTPSTATGIHFDNPLIVGLAGTGNYANIVANATFKDFQFSPVLTPSPVDPLWTFNYNNKTYDFIMSSVNSSVSPDGSSLTLVGTGTLQITGFTDTPGTWSFTTQGDEKYLGFSAESTVAPVPEPGTVILLSAGLLGLVIFGKRWMGNAAELC